MLQIKFQFCYISFLFPVISSLFINNKLPIHSYKSLNGKSYTKLLFNTIKASNFKEEDSLPRLHKDIDGLFQFVLENNGSISNVYVYQKNDGWNLRASTRFSAGDVIATIPKKLCISSQPEMMNMPLGENTIKLVSSIDPSLWRLRLAIALLSERVRPSSFFRPYLRNLPFEFWGTPLFFTPNDFNAMQDSNLMHQTRDRCRVLTDLVMTVISPMQRTPNDPFYGYSVDINALGWGFACASSRALRLPHEAVLVPILDLISHSFKPNCEVIDNGLDYQLKTIETIPAGSEFTINYGPLSNEELFSDYGFTVDDNPYDKIIIKCDTSILDLGRAAMGQSRWMVSDNVAAASSSSLSRRRLISGGDKLEDRRLSAWQIDWLRTLNLVGPSADIDMRVSVRAVDPRIWAYLRVLYAPCEADLTAHGWDPLSLQDPGSMVSLDIEAAVVKTIIGVLGIQLRIMGSDLKHDIYSLQNNLYEESSNQWSDSRSLMEGVDRVLRAALRLPEVMSASPSVRKLQEAVASSMQQSPPKKSRLYDTSAAPYTTINSQVNSSLEKSLEDIIRSQVMGPSNEPDRESSMKRVNDNNDVIDIQDEKIESMDEISAEDIDEGINAYGKGLAVNVRESLKYRIRRKQTLADVIFEMGEIHKRIQNVRGLEDDLLPPIPAREDRRTKIKELISDSARDQPETMGKESDLAAAAEMLSAGWVSKGLNL